MKNQIWIFVMLGLAIAVSVFLVVNQVQFPIDADVENSGQKQVEETNSGVINENEQMDSTEIDEQMPNENPITQEEINQLTIQADDSGFYIDGEQIDSIEVANDEKVRILFQVKTEDVYFNGLDFRGFGIDVGAKPGESVEFEFTTKQRETITSYWPSSQAIKERLIVNVV